MFVLQNAPLPPSLGSELALSPLDFEGSGSKFDLTLSIQQGPDGLRGWVEFSTDLFDASTIARFVGHFQAVLEAATTDPHQPVAALPILGSQSTLDRRALPATDCAPFEVETPLIAPRDTLELELTRIWEHVLQTGPVGVRDNFFVLGGHSLSAVRLMAGVQERLGRTLPLSALFQGATVEEMARRLREQPGSPPWSPLVAIQPAGSRRPFFCVHPAGGTVLCYAGLARLLGPDQPFYGLEARGAENGQAPHARVEDMAALYLAALRGVQPAGPYRLGGWSFGGFVAFEMAQTLVREGEQVDLLVLIDTLARPVTGRGEALDDLPFLLSFVRGLDLAASPDALRRLDPDQQLHRVVELARDAGVIPPGFGAAHLRRWLGVARAHAQAASRYAPRRYPGRITVFRAGERLPERDGSDPSDVLRDPTLGWGELCAAAVEVHEMPGHHDSMHREPHVRALADRLSRCLLAGDRRPAGSRRSVEPHHTDERQTP